MGYLITQILWMLAISFALGVLTPFVFAAIRRKRRRAKYREDQT